jgi:hypothetical protein
VITVLILQSPAPLVKRQSHMTYRSEDGKSKRVEVAIFVVKDWACKTPRTCNGNECNLDAVICKRVCIVVGVLFLNCTFFDAGDTFISCIVIKQCLVDIQIMKNCT